MSVTESESLLAGGAAAVARAVACGDARASDLVEAALARIARLDPGLGAFSAVTAQRARAEAAAIDQQRARGAALPPLAGVPYAVKNLFDVRGAATLSGSRLLANEPPAATDAVAVQRLAEAGAVLVGMLTMDEFAYGFTTENSHYGPARNPHDPSRVAGGSSGGSAAAVGAALVPLSLGSDTNGSIRVPASFCGVFGLKPTYGRLSRRGSYPFVHSLDHVGPFGRTVADLALAYDAMQGPDPLDPACAQRPLEATAGALGERPLRVALLGGYFTDNAGAQARAAAERAAQALGGRATVSVPLAAAGRASAFIITAAEGGALHRAHLRDGYELMEPRSRDRLAAGAALPSAWYLQAQRVRALYRAQLLPLFSCYDVLIAPSAPLPAPPIGAETMTINGREIPARPNIGLLTQPISCIGLPVAAVPILLDEPLPMGVQLIGAPWREDLVLAAAAQLERAGVAGARLPARLAPQ